MRDTDQTPVIQVHDVLAAFSLLTRLPVPVDHALAGTRAHIATWAFPLVGAVVGGISGLVMMLAMALLLPTGLAAAFAMLTLIGLTGAMHEDGLADCADGFWGGHNPERRLEIMKDSSIGAYGAVVLITFLLAQWSAMESLVFANPILTFAAVGAISRLPMVLAMWKMPSARETGLSAGVGKPTMLSVQIACGLTIVIALGALGWVGLSVFAFALICTLPVVWIAFSKIGGQTGDVLGATQKCAELGALSAILVL